MSDQTIQGETANVPGATVAPDTSDHEALSIHAGPQGETLLEIDHVTLRFGGVVALNDVNFEIRRGEILGLIGPNGAGKTTCFNAMTGVYTPTEGKIRFKGKEIAGTKPHKINQLGIARTFQNIRLFPEMSALENVLVGCDARHKTSVLGVLFRAYRVRPTEDELAAMDKWPCPEFRSGWDSYFKDKPDKPVMHYSVIAGWFGDHMVMPPGKFFTMFHFLEVLYFPLPPLTISTWLT